MENSQAYKYLIEQINSTGSKKMDGYYPKILEEVFDWEKKDVEDIIWDNFVNKNDFDLSIFLPKLKNHNGVEALKDKLEKCRIPSENSVNIAKVLYESTDDNYYLKIIKENIEKSPNEGSYVAMLSYAKPSPQLYDLLVEIYINNDNEIIRGSAVKGILFNKQFIIDPYNFKEIIGMSTLRKKFDKRSRKEREEVIKQLQDGKFNIYKHNVLDIKNN